MNRFKFFTFKVNFSSIQSQIFFAVFLYYSLLFPWKLFNFFRLGNFVWSDLNNYVYSRFWMQVTSWSTENIACQVKPNWCLILNAKNTIDIRLSFWTAILTFILHPLQWYFIKMHEFNHFWFSNIAWNELFFNQKIIFLQGLLILLMVFIGFFLSGIASIKPKSVEMRCVFVSPF